MKTEFNGNSATLILAIIGLTISLYLTYIHVRIHLDPDYESLCAVGDTLNCETVATSKYATVIGIPLSVIGGLFYILLGIAALFGLVGRNTVVPGIRTAVTAIGMFVSIFLFILSATTIKAFCLLCVATLGINIVLFTVALLAIRATGGLRRNLADDVVTVVRQPRVAAAAVAGLMLIIVAGPLRGFPRYWELASWTSGVHFDHGFTADGLPWIGADSPTLTITEYFDFGCPSCRIAHKKLRRYLSKHKSNLRIIRHDMPRIACMSHSGKAGGRCIAARAAYCAGLSRRYWEWNDAVIAHPKPVTGAAKKNYEIALAVKLGFDKDAFTRCLADEKTIAHAVWLQTTGKKQKVTHTPTYFMNSRMLVGYKNLMAAISAL
jgi:uncharacterized membrane protein